MALNKIKEWQLDLTNINAKIDAMDSASLRQDLDELGDQVSEIEAKIPGTTTDTNQLVNKQQLLDEEMDIREDMMQTDSELQQQINALADAIQSIGPAEGTYTEENLIGGKGVEIVPEATGGGKDEHTIALWHFEDTLTDEISGLEFYSASDKDPGFDVGKFGRGFRSVRGGDSGSILLSDRLFADRNFKDIDFTIDAWHDNAFSGGFFIATGRNSSSAAYNGFCVNFDTSYNKISVKINNVEKASVSYTFSQGGNFWHKAMQKNGDTLTAYLNGEPMLSYTLTEADKALCTYEGFYVGGGPRIDELRVSDVARYSGSFTPPTEPYSEPVLTGRSFINNTAGKNIGEVFYSQSNSASDNVGALPLFTGETIANADALYPEFFSWVSSHSELQTTAEEYESALTTYGECPKYVLSAGSLRLPKLANYIKMANTAEGITQSLEGLPDHTHTTNYSEMRSGDTNSVDCWRGTTEVQTGPASESNPIYGRSEHVTPAHTTLYPWVYAYNSAIPASTTQAAEFQSALSGKADTNLGNTEPSASFKTMVVDWARPDWTRAIATGLAGSPISTTTPTYTCPSSGYILLYAYREPAGNTLFLKLNGEIVHKFPAFYSAFANGLLEVSEGDVVQLTTDSTDATWAVQTCNFLPCKGV